MKCINYFIIVAQKLYIKKKNELNNENYLLCYWKIDKYLIK